MAAFVLSAPSGAPASAFTGSHCRTNTPRSRISSSRICVLTCNLSEEETSQLSSARVSRRDLIRNAVLSTVSISSVLGAAAINPQAALAERDLMTAKRSYFRYAPRFEGGMDFYVLTLYPAIAAGDWKNVMDAYVPKSDAVEGSEKAKYGIDRKVSDLQRYLFDPMSIWAQSFAEKGSGPNYRYLAAREEALEDQMRRLKEIASSGKWSKDKQNEGMDQQTAALDAWSKGREAINEYIVKANANLSRELRKIEVIPETIENYQPHTARPKPYGSFQ
mmetsp:Transcript_16271/g.35287  ORF Transcript_16271/g.35287 Transcript_16271/m.35287 type:complete len:276 (-) Transcript_16271:1565-2392(-)